jgi:hypothetical protein
MVCDGPFLGVSVPITVPLKRDRFGQLYDKPMFPGFLWSEWQDLNLSQPVKIPDYRSDNRPGRRAPLESRGTALPTPPSKPASSISGDWCYLRVPRNFESFWRATPRSGRGSFGRRSSSQSSASRRHRNCSDNDQPDEDSSGHEIHIQDFEAMSACCHDCRYGQEAPSDNKRDKGFQCEHQRPALNWAITGLQVQWTVQ